jgi:hypothetical protein
MTCGLWWGGATLAASRKRLRNCGMGDQMDSRDIVILFGAGASFGAGHVLPAAPPLGLALYDALATQYPNVWGPDSHPGKMWGDKLRRDFERAMAEDVLPQCPR